MFFFSSRRRHTRCSRDWSSDVCSSDLKAVAHIPVGPGLSGMREHPTRPEILGISALGGFAWIFDARAYQVSARIPVGPLPYARSEERRVGKECRSRWSPYH